MSSSGPGGVAPAMRFNAPTMSGDLRAQAGDALRADGQLRLARLGGRDDILCVARQLMSELWPHRDADPDGLTVIRDTGRHSARAGFAGLGRGGLPVHTECAQLPLPPRLLLLACARAGDVGGDSLLADGQGVLAELAGLRPAAVEALMAPRAAFFGGAGGRFAPVLEQLTPGRWRIQLRQDSLARFSPEAAPHIPALRAAIDRHTVRLRLEPGQALVLDNHRLLHGRTAFSGGRLLLRALGEPHPDLRMDPGFAAASSPGTARKRTA